MDKSIHFSKENGQQLVDKLNSLKTMLSENEYRKPHYSLVRDKYGYYKVKITKFFTDDREHIFYL